MKKKELILIINNLNEQFDIASDLENEIEEKINNFQNEIKDLHFKLFEIKIQEDELDKKILKYRNKLLGQELKKRKIHKSNFDLTEVDKLILALEQGDNQLFKKYMRIKNSGESFNNIKKD